jgi:hypothetical protein
MASGGLAGGLANGMNNALQLYMQNKYYGGLNDSRDERNRILAEKEAAQAEARASGKGVNFDEFDKNVLPILGGGKPTNFADKMKPVRMGNSAAGLGPDTLPDVGALSSNAPTAYQSAGLASTQRPAPPDPDADLSPRQRIVKGIMSGNLANDPDKLSAINAAAVMSGVGKEVTPWLEGLYNAKKTGLFDAAMDLKRGNIDGAMDNLKRGGIQLEDRPSRVDPNDNSKWKVNISGTGEQTINLDDWATSTLDPEKYSKFLLDRQGAADKSRLTDAQIDNQKAGAEKDRAMAKAYGAGSLGAGRRNGGAGGLTPTVRKTVETDQGIVAIMSDGSKRIISDDQGNPLFGTSGLKTAAGLIGKTIDPMSDTGEIAGKVNDLTNQLRGGKSMPAPAPSGKVRKFNPQTGQFD